MADGTILVVGATGNTGSGVVKALLAQGRDVRALVRNPEKGKELEAQGVSVVIGDLDDASSLQPSLFDGVGVVYFATWNGPTALQQSKNFLAAIKAAGASPRIVRLSAFGTPGSRIVQQLLEAEEDIKSSGLKWTILQPTFFMQNTMMFAPTVKEQGAVYFDWGEGKAGIIDVRDIVDSAVGVLTADDGRYDGETVVLTGPQSIGWNTIAEEIGNVAGKPVQYTAVPHDTAVQGMVGAGVPEWIAEGYGELSVGFEAGYADTTTDGVRRLAGHDPRSYAEFARDFAGVFAG